jgi:membrane-associated phospholipid phosphatase
LDLVGIDRQIAALDHALFGVHLHEIWLPRMGAVWMSELMHFFYYAYYPSIYIPAIAVAIMGKHTAIRDMTFRLTVVYLTCFVVYIIFPVDGPHVLMEHTQGAHTDGFFYGLVEMAQQIGDSRGCSFPSSHVAGATTIAILAWRWLPRWAGILLTIEAIGVLLSTAYTQHHYFVDSVAGMLWALLFNFVLAVPLLRALGGYPPVESVTVGGQTSGGQA